MKASRRFDLRPALLAGAALFAALPLFGCGDQTGLAKRYAVSGKVSYKGQAVEKGTISFLPTTPDGRPASGEIDNGRYALTTLSPNDGALPGTYKVTVTSPEVDNTELKAIAKGGQFHHDKAFAKAVKNAKALVPSKYGLADTSGLEKEVKAESNTFDFDLVD